MVFYSSLHSHHIQYIGELCVVPAPEAHMYYCPLFLLSESVFCIGKQLDFKEQSNESFFYTSFEKKCTV
jgi:hypothetical protein